MTTGASEALQSTLLAFVERGDEVVMFEPRFDIYAAGVSLADGVRVGVPLSGPGLRPDIDKLRAAITPRTKVLLLNSPHNPTGIVFTRDELEAVAEVAIEHDLLVISDEAYEHLWFEDHHHIPIATLPGMWERTVTVGSGGKSFSFTGWKVGWAYGPHELIRAVSAVRQHLSFVSGGPFQYAIAHGLRLPDTYFTEFRRDLAHKRDLLSDGLAHCSVATPRIEPRSLPSRTNSCATTRPSDCPMCGGPSARSPRSSNKHSINCRQGWPHDDPGRLRGVALARSAVGALDQRRLPR